MSRRYLDTVEDTEKLEREGIVLVYEDGETIRYTEGFWMTLTLPDPNKPESFWFRIARDGEPPNYLLIGQV